MATAEEITDPLIDNYTRVPPAQPGICRVCHGPVVNPDYDLCYVCEWKIRQRLSYLTEPVVPISLAGPLGAFHHSLKYYKEPGSEAATLQTQLAALLHRFLTIHRGCIVSAAGSDWDTITSVPSSRGRIPHPLEAVIRRSSLLEPKFVPLLARGPGDVGHQRPSDDAYVPQGEVAGRRILLIDDTYTSGARAQSAACALRLAGASVVAIVAIERHVNPDFSPGFLERSGEIPFDFETCCLPTDAHHGIYL